MSEDVPPYQPRAAAGAGVDPNLARANAAAAAILETQQQSTVLAGVMITSLASTMSGKFDAFATWLLAGFGAAVVLLLTNHEASALVAPGAIHCGAQLFIWSVVIVVVEKYLAIVVTGSGDAAAAARAAVKEHLDKGQTLDLDVFVREFTRPLFRPFRWFARRALARVKAGDLNAGARPTLVIAQFQGLLVFAQIVLFVIALAKIVGSLSF